MFFDAICSDLSKFSVARACAASSAVPGVFSPISVRNYAGTCGYTLPSYFDTPCLDYRQKEMRANLTAMLDSKEKPYFHLIDGGVADNLGLRAIEETVSSVGDAWTTMKMAGKEKVRKVVFHRCQRAKKGG